METNKICRIGGISLVFLVAVGLPGVILGIPAYAVIKVVLVYLFTWYQTYTGLYDDDFNPAPKPLISEKKKKLR